MKILCFYHTVFDGCIAVDVVELKTLAESADFAWIALASDRLAEVERGMRRNLLRSLSLDAFATTLERST